MKPKLLEVQLTGSCNLKCLYCGNSEEYIHNSNASKDTILKAISELQPEKILFTGGEVYLNWKLLIEILDCLELGKYQYILSSNLTLINEKEIDILINKYGFKTFHTSFNDLNDEMTYKIRGGTPEDRRKLINNIKHICSRKMAIKVETMLIPDTIEYLKEINALLFSLGVIEHKLECLICVGQASKDLLIESQTILDKVLELYLNKNNQSVLILTCFPMSPCIMDHKLFYINKPDFIFNKCIDGIETCYLLANGTLLPCFLFPDKNITSTETSYLDQWENGKDFVGIRENNKKCTICDFFQNNTDASRKICNNGCSVLNYIKTNSYGSLVTAEKND